MSAKATRWAYGLFEGGTDLPPAERAVLLALCYRHKDDGGCFPSQETIALMSGYRERKVRDLLASLEARGLIKRKRVKVEGKFSHTTYRLFGTPKPGATGRRGPLDHRHSPAGRSHRQTGADYRGTILDTDIDKVLPFPGRKNA